MNNRYLILLIISVLLGIVLGGFVFRNTKERIFILNPSLTPINTRSAAMEGNPDAQITINEFSDLECPYCAKNQNVLKQLMNKYSGKIKYYFHNFPLSFHENAKMLAKAVDAASMQGKSKEMREALFWLNSDARNESTVIKIARGMDLDTNKFKEYYYSNLADEQLQKEIEEGRELGVRSTPTVFINGYLVKGAVGLDVYCAVIEKILNKR